MLQRINEFKFVEKIKRIDKHLDRSTRERRPKFKKKKKMKRETQQEIIRKLRRIIRKYF